MGSVPSLPAASAPTTAPTPSQPGTNILGAPLTAEPEQDTTTNVPRGSHRTLVNNVWIVEPDEHPSPSDVYRDHATFMEPKSSVQIVTFHMADNVEQSKRAVWANPLKTPHEVSAALGKEQEVNTWRWIHCEGLHGPTMKAIAEGSGWALPTFARVFSWSRPSAECLEGNLLVHFVDEFTPIWMLYNGEASNPVFITCTRLEPSPVLKKRWEDFVDYGDSRPNLLIRKDPSLMLYAIVRAITQDLRATAFEKHEDMYAAYDLALSQPSMKSLRYFYELQQCLIRIKLNTTALRDAVKSLLKFVDKMHKELGAREKPPPVSENTRYMLRDQMGLIALLVDELPEVTTEAQAVASLAFNSLSFNTNNLLRLLAVLTIAAVPLSITSGILSLDYFDKVTVDGKKIAMIFGSVFAAVLLLLCIFLLCGYTKLWKPRYRQGIEQRNADLEGWSAMRSANDSQRFASLMARNQRARDHRSRLNSIYPDRYQSSWTHASLPSASAWRTYFMSLIRQPP